MGLCNSAPKESQRSRNIDLNLYNDRRKQWRLKRILLTGSQGSGKTTLIKQLIRIYGEGFSMKDRKDFIQSIHNQIINDMLLAIDWAELLEELIEDDYDDLHKNMTMTETAQSAAFKLQNISNTDDSSNDNFIVYGFIRGLNLQSIIIPIEIYGLCLRFYSNITMSPFIGELITILWNEAIIKEMYSQRGMNHIIDSSAYFWDEIDRISQRDYVPTDVDIMNVYKPSKKFIECTVSMEYDTEYKIYEVNGIGGTPTKYLHCFQFCSAIIFVASLSCYDESCIDDEWRNKMDEQLNLFRETCENQWLQEMKIIIFFNKKDLFAQKIERIPISVCQSFVSYRGPDNYEECVEFIRRQFEDIADNANRGRYRNVFSHITCVTDSHQVEWKWRDVGY